MFTRTHSVRIWLPAILAVGALTLAGCSGGGKSKAAEPDEGPLGKYYSALWDDEEFTQEKFDAENLKTEELVAECMVKEGFEYTPNTQNGGMVSMDSEDSEGPEWGTVEFAKEYGYGIVNFPGREEAPGPDTEYVDPNQEYIDSLSESEQTAFYEALSGPGLSEEQWAELEESGEGYSPELSEQGCYGKAQLEIQKETGSAGDPWQDPEFAELFEAMGAVGSEVYDVENLAPEMVAVNEEWAACMAPDFSEFTSPMETEMLMYEEYNTLSMPDGETGEYKEPSKKDTDAFAAREIKVATADYTCRDQVKFTETQQEIQFAAEQKFVDEHQAELDALLSKYSTKQK